MKKYVNGEYMEMTDAEIAEIKQAEATAFYTELDAPLTFERKLQLLIEAIPETPQPRAASRPGYLWKPIYDLEGNCFGWEEIVDPYYTPTQSGTYIDPVLYRDGMPVTAELWYSFDDGNVWECIRTGTNSAYTAEWFDIVEV